jgi:hypothetical protein
MCEATLSLPHIVGASLSTASIRSIFHKTPFFILESNWPLEVGGRVGGNQLWYY